MKITIEDTVLSGDKLNVIHKGIAALSDMLHEKIWVELKSIEVPVAMAVPKSITELNEDFIGDICILDDVDACCDEQPVVKSTKKNK